MSADSVIQRCMDEVPRCVAAGIVDMETGLLLAVRTMVSHPQEVFDLVAAATRDLFQGDHVTTIERIFARMRGVEDGHVHYFQEIVVTSRTLLHFFARLSADPAVVVVAVCRADTNLGLVLARGRDIARTERL